MAATVEARIQATSIFTKDAQRDGQVARFCVLGGNRILATDYTDWRRVDSCHRLHGFHGLPGMY